MRVTAHVRISEQDLEDEQTTELVDVEHQLLEEGNQGLKPWFSRGCLEERYAIHQAHNGAGSTGYGDHGNDKRSEELAEMADVAPFDRFDKVVVEQRKIRRVSDVSEKLEDK